jgi:hypothetical protein
MTPLPQVAGRQPRCPLSGIAATKLTAVLELADHHASHVTTTGTGFKGFHANGTQLSLRRLLHV